MSSVSIVVPAYNEEDIIEDTLHHLDDLEEYADEVYLVDDGSTDNTGDIIQDFYAENDTEVKAVTMIENSNKVGAIEEAVRHTDSDYVILTDSDTRLTNPENLDDAVAEIDENEYGGMALRVSPDYSQSGFFNWLKNGLQDFEYSIGRQAWQLTTSDKVSDHKKLRCVPGASGIYDREVLENSFEHHSGKHAGDDIETTTISQLTLEEDINYSKVLDFETEVPTDHAELRSQRKRWAKGVLQAVSEHPKEYAKEIFSGSAFGLTKAYELGITLGTPVMIGSIAASAAAGDTGNAADLAEKFYAIDSGLVFTRGAIAAAQGEMDKKNLALTPLMPFHRASIYLPSKVGSQAEFFKEKGIESVNELLDGFNEATAPELDTLGEQILESEEEREIVPSIPADD